MDRPLAPVRFSCGSRAAGRRSIFCANFRRAGRHSGRKGPFGTRMSERLIIIIILSVIRCFYSARFSRRRRSQSLAAAGDDLVLYHGANPS